MAPRGNQNAKDRGRPTKYRPEYVSVIRKLCEMGATDDEISDAIGVSISTFKGWRNLYPEFNEAVRVGKDAADERVVRALYSRAVGYTFDSVKIFPPAGKRKRPLKVPFREHIPPDTTAARYWLAHRRRAEWMEEQDINVRAKFELMDTETLRLEIASDIARLAAQGIIIDAPASLTSDTSTEVVLANQTVDPSNAGEYE